MTTEIVRRVGSDTGRLLQLTAGLLVSSLVVPLVWQEFYAIPGILLSGLLTFSVGSVLRRWCATESEPKPVHGFVTAAVGWFVIGTASSLPFLLVAWTAALDPGFVAAPQLTPTLAVFLDPTNALFEGMSGITGTGLTMTRHESELPATLQW